MDASLSFSSKALAVWVTEDGKSVCIQTDQDMGYVCAELAVLGFEDILPSSLQGAKLGVVPGALTVQHAEGGDMVSHLPMADGLVTSVAPIGQVRSEYRLFLAKGKDLYMATFTLMLKNFEQIQSLYAASHGIRHVPISSSERSPDATMYVPVFTGSARKLGSTTKNISWVFDTAGQLYTHSDSSETERLRIDLIVANGEQLTLYSLKLAGNGLMRVGHIPITQFGSDVKIRGMAVVNGGLLIATELALLNYRHLEEGPVVIMVSELGQLVGVMNLFKINALTHDRDSNTVLVATNDGVLVGRDGEDWHGIQPKLQGAVKHYQTSIAYFERHFRTPYVFLYTDIPLTNSNNEALTPPYRMEMKHERPGAKWPEYYDEAMELQSSGSETTSLYSPERSVSDSPATTRVTRSGSGRKNIRGPRGGDTPYSGKPISIGGDARLRLRRYSSPSNRGREVQPSLEEQLYSTSLPGGSSVYMDQIARAQGLYSGSGVFVLPPMVHPSVKK